MWCPRCCWCVRRDKDGDQVKYAENKRLPCIDRPMEENRGHCRKVVSSEHRFGGDPWLSGWKRSTLLSPTTMNLIVRLFQVYSPSSLHSITGDPLWTHRHPCRTPSPASAFTHKGPARTGPRTYQTRTEREKAHNGHQEECKGRSTGLLFHVSRQYQPTKCHAARTHAKSWPKTSSELVVMSTSSIRCALNFRPSVFAYKPCEVISKWRKPCVVLRE